MAYIYPSLLAANPLTLAKTIDLLDGDPLCMGYHLDVMDNHFVHNQGINYQTINEIAKKSTRPLWVHLMVEQPELYLERLRIEPGSIVTFHIESKGHKIDLINRIKEKKWKPGIAINPNTSLESLFPYLALIHQALIMSVEPGFSGQPFFKETITKLGPLFGYRNTSHTPFRIALDGGIGFENIKELAHMGVDDFAVGSAIFDHKDPQEALNILADRCK